MEDKDSKHEVESAIRIYLKLGFEVDFSTHEKSLKKPLPSKFSVYGLCDINAYQGGVH